MRHLPARPSGRTGDGAGDQAGDDVADDVGDEVNAGAATVGDAAGPLPAVGGGTSRSRVEDSASVPHPLTTAHSARTTACGALARIAPPR
ncbi:hypothetical protein GCM10022214_64580 [Actinomadura miaoliensis]|uniref:Uncharacterized protein n=1 Tax=Actinomadura miaoliensis TaxID=430685 RepID=A0ABP7WPJ1_9ACTN